jgi:predicted nucleic acid-binding protein
MTYLLDTNIVSEVHKTAPDPNVMRWFGQTDQHELRLSVLTLGEIRRGIERIRVRDSAKAAAIDRWLEGLVAQFSSQFAAIDADVAITWGRISAPRPLAVVDGLIAATAKVHGWTLVTRNVRDLAGVDVSLLNPFDA